MQLFFRQSLEFLKNTPRDRIILSLIGLITYLVAMRLDIYERIDAWFRHTPELEYLQLDELLVVAVVVSIGLGVVAWRRYNELYISNTRFRLMFDEAPIGMSIQDMQGRYLYANPALCRCLGYTEAEFQATDFRNLTYVDDIAPGDALREKLLKGERQSRNAGGAQGATRGQRGVARTEPRQERFCGDGQS